MAVRIQTAQDLRRTTNIAPVTGTYWCGFWMKVNAATHPDGDTAVAFLDDTVAYTNWIGIYRMPGAGVKTWRLDISGIGVTAAFTAELGEWNYYEYERSGTTHRFRVNGTVIGTLTGSVAAFTIGIQLFGNDTYTTPDLEIAYISEYTETFSTTERDGIRGANGVAEPDPHAWFALASNALDTGGLNHHLTETGSPSFTAQPGIPGNTSRLTPRVLATTLENGGAQTVTQDTYFRGFTYTVWYKYTAVAGENQIGLFAYGNFSTYRPVTTIRWPLVDSNSLVGAGKERCFQFPAHVAGVEYFIQLNKGSSPDASPSTLTIEWYRFLDRAVPIGAIGINDEKPGLPTSFVARGTNYSTYRFVQDVANGDHGAQLADGTLALDDGNALGLGGLGRIKIYSDSLLSTLVATISRTLASGSMTSNRRDVFYFLTTGTTSPIVSRYSAAGVLLGTLTPATGGGFFNTMCVSPDDTILYYTLVSGTTIKRWSIPGNSALADLVVGLPALPSQTEMLCLDDGSIIVLLANLTVRRYSSAGALLNTYTFPAGSSIFAGSRLAHDLTDAYFWVRDHDFSTYNTFYRINVETGVADTVLHASFLKGVYGESDVTDPTPTPLSRFGTPESCPIWIVPGEGECPPTSPLQINCWAGHSPVKALGGPDCLATPVGANCWDGDDIDDRRVGLLDSSVRDHA